MSDWKSFRWLVKTVRAPFVHNEQWIAWTEQDELWCKKEINVNVAHNGERNSLSESLRNTLGEKSHRGDEICKLENAHQTIRFFFSGHMHFLRIIGWDKKKVHVESIVKGENFFSHESAYLLDVLFLISTGRAGISKEEKKDESSDGIFHSVAMRWILPRTTSSAFPLQSNWGCWINLVREVHQTHDGRNVGGESFAYDSRNFLFVQRLKAQQIVYQNCQLRFLMSF